jgi:hypothetical protein
VKDAEQKELLQYWCPRLRYAAQAAFYAIAVEAVTDSPGTRVVSDGATMASATGVPVLSLDWLGATADSIGENAVLTAAMTDSVQYVRQLQSRPDYADRVYGRVVEREGRPAFLQYWLFFYGSLFGNPTAARPTWRLLQLDLDKLGRPERAIARNTTLVGRPPREYAVQRQLDVMARRLPVFVSASTNNLYFEPGEIRPMPLWDHADGQGRTVVPTVELFEKGWERWPGTWGAGRFSCHSPGRTSAWEHPETADVDDRWPRVQRAIRGLLAGLARNDDPPEDVTISPRLDAGRLVVDVEASSKVGVLVTVHHGDQVIAAGLRPPGGDSSETVIAVPDAPAQCEVRARANTKWSRKGGLASASTAADAPDELEDAVLRRIVRGRLQEGEIQAFVNRLPGVTGDDLEAAITKAARPRKNPRKQSRLWSRVASDMQAFRAARYDQTRLQTAREQEKRATRRVVIAIAAFLATLGVWPGIVHVFGMDVGLLVLSIGYYLLLAYAAIFVVDQARKLMVARATIEELASSGPASDDPLAEARSAFERALSEKAVGPIMRERINAATTDRYEEVLDFGDEGLPDLPVAEYEVPTAASERLDRLTERMRGGSIGIAGPRGAGKTTLIESFCAPRTAADRRLTTILAAPVRYDARDFVLTLFGQLCTVVLSGSDRRQLAFSRGWGLPLRYGLGAVLFGAGAGAITASASLKDDSWLEAAALLGGTALAALAAPVALKIELKSTLWATAGVVVAAFLAWVALDLRVPLSVTATFLVIAAALVVGAVLKAIRGAKRAMAPGPKTPEDQLRARATRHLEEIRYQQTFARGYSGKLAIPLGGEISTQTQDTLARRQSTFPEVVASFRDFLRVAVAARGQVVIGIDEMDKMESGEVAQQFLNEIKVIFGADRVFYLVSISEGAMSSFERRGLPFRDVFDSSFDEVLSVDPLSLQESTELLRGRTVGLGPPYLDLCHCISGGLARDLLRAARQLSLLNRQGKCLAEVCPELVKSELGRKVQAATVSAREIASEPYVSDLLFWLRGIAREPITVDALMERSAREPASWADGRSAAAPERELFDRLERVRLELATYAYYLATVLEFFTEVQGEPADWFGAAEEARLDRLAQARIAFGTNPHLAASIVDAFRREQWPGREAPARATFAARGEGASHNGGDPAESLEHA